MIIYIILLQSISSYSIKDQSQDTLFAQNGTKYLRIDRIDGYSGHAGEYFDFLLKYEAIDNGFDLVFDSPTNDVNVKIENNIINVNVEKRTKHFYKQSQFTINFAGGNVYDVAKDEIRRTNKTVTVLSLKLNDGGDEMFFEWIKNF